MNKRQRAKIEAEKKSIRVALKKLNARIRKHNANVCRLMPLRTADSWQRGRALLSAIDMRML